MDSIIRAMLVYVFLLVAFRIAGKRTLGEITTFDFIMLLIISETTQEALTDGDHSMTNSLLLILTFLAMNVGLSLWKQRSKAADKLIEGTPLLLVEHGRPLPERLALGRIDEEDVLAAARASQGLARMEQIEYAILERGGGISIIPR